MAYVTVSPLAKSRDLWKDLFCSQCHHLTGHDPTIVWKSLPRIRGSVALALLFGSRGQEVDTDLATVINTSSNPSSQTLLFSTALSLSLLRPRGSFLKELI
jgi:hypothetical protein